MSINYRDITSKNLGGKNFVGRHYGFTASKRQTNSVRIKFLLFVWKQFWWKPNNLFIR